MCKDLKIFTTAGNFMLHNKRCLGCASLKINGHELLSDHLILAGQSLAIHLLLHNPVYKI